MGLVAGIAEDDKKREKMGTLKKQPEAVGASGCYGFSSQRTY
jgi:hypothetical protein